ncbi:MAG: YARHG domain-containing protein [Vulcanimicrobiota bacterium]
MKKLFVFCLGAIFAQGYALAQDLESLRGYLQSAYTGSRIVGIETEGPWSLASLRHPGSPELLQCLFRSVDGGWLRISQVRRYTVVSAGDLLDAGVPSDSLGKLLGHTLTAEEKTSLTVASPPVWYTKNRLGKELPDGLASDPWSLMLERNSIFAYHGRTFKDAALRAAFASRPWYHPNPSYSDRLLNSNELANVQALQGFEQRAWKKLRLERGVWKAVP